MLRMSEKQGHSFMVGVHCFQLDKLGVCTVTKEFSHLKSIPSNLEKKI